MLRNVFQDNTGVIQLTKGLLSTEKKGKGPVTIISRANIKPSASGLVTPLF